MARRGRKVELCRQARALAPEASVKFFNLLKPSSALADVVCLVVQYEEIGHSAHNHAKVDQALSRAGDWLSSEELVAAVSHDDALRSSLPTR